MTDNIFSKRLGDIYDYSSLKYINGDAEISFGENIQRVRWELCSDVSGETHLQISYSGIPLKTNNFALKGETEDQHWIIESEKVYALNKNYKSEKSMNTIYCKAPEINISKKQSGLEINKA